MTTRHLESSRTFNVDVESAYQRVLTVPLPEIFAKRYLAIAPIVEVTGQEGEWGTSVGQTRTIKLRDGGTMLETLTTIEQPHRFGYTIGNVTGMMKPLVAAASGMWTFVPDGDGVRVVWSWDVTPTKVGSMAMPVFARLWAGYARQAMDHIDTILADR